MVTSIRSACVAAVDPWSSRSRPNFRRIVLLSEETLSGFVSMSRMALKSRMSLPPLRPPLSVSVSWPHPAPKT